jgi:meso-butanediol dehydrogenase/(S,S)-butanediol dehydrogenase/diacetyl reductase
MSNRVEGKVAIVTGAASGMGTAIAGALAAEGARVGVADLNLAGAEAVAAKIREDGGQAIALAVDVADRASVTRMIAAAVAEFGRLDIMFNNAGIIEIVPFLDMSEDTWNKTLRVNGNGVLLGTQEAARQMIAQKSGGKIINTASIASYEVSADSVAYCASKFVVSAITKGAAKALGKHGITVNNFAPGIVETPMWQKIDDGLMKHGLTERRGQAMESSKAGIILGRPGTPRDVIGVTTFLASSDSDYITGQTIMIDGGMVLL